jgi:seryl-tRNA synthetase
MLDLKYVRENPDKVIAALKSRGLDLGLDEFLAHEKKRRELLVEVEALKSTRNSVSQEISRRKKSGEPADDMIAEMRAAGDKIAALDTKVKETESALEAILLTIPNLPHASVPVGGDETANPEIRRWGTPRTFDFEPLPHWDIGENLRILDFACGAKITGARFTLYRGWGAKLERALFNYMLDLHTTQHTYTEVLTPFMVNKESMTGTGQLPKFEQDLFKIQDRKSVV